MKGFNCRLYLVTDNNSLAGKDLLLSIEEALRAGVTLLQLREKNIGSKDYFELALEVKKLCDKYGVPLIINDRVDIALAVKAAGVHIGQEDLPLPVVRELLGDDAIIGVTAHNVEEALLAEKQGADYLGVGCVFHTATKLDTVLIGLDGLRKICGSVNIPIAAIGGIYPVNAREPLRAGASGVAVARGILGEEDVAGATKLFLFSLQDGDR